MPHHHFPREADLKMVRDFSVNFLPAFQCLGLTDEKVLCHCGHPQEMVGLERFE
jgi:hypothetical protein